MQRNLAFRAQRASRAPRVLSALAFALIVGLAGCSPAAPEVAAVPPTKTPKPTFTRMSRRPSDPWSWDGRSRALIVSSQRSES